jgi:hypothetical protein
MQGRVMLAMFYLDASGRIIGRLWSMVPIERHRDPHALAKALDGLVWAFATASTSDWGGMVRAPHNDH